MSELTINSEQSLEAAIKQLRDTWEDKKYLKVKVSTGRTRTAKQNASMWLWLTQVSEALNAAGYDFRKGLRQDIEVPWNKDLAKDYLWSPVQEALLGFEGTSKCERKDYDTVYEVLNRHLAARFGISVEWPQEEG